MTLTHLYRLIELAVSDFGIDLLQDFEEEQKVPVVLAQCHEVVKKGVPAPLRVIDQKDRDHNLSEFVEYDGLSLIRGKPAVQKLSKKCLIVLTVLLVSGIRRNPCHGLHCVT